MQDFFVNDSDLRIQQPSVSRLISGMHDDLHDVAEPERQPSVSRLISGMHDDLHDNDKKCIDVLMIG